MPEHSNYVDIIFSDSAAVKVELTLIAGLKLLRLSF